ncbi:hypothetical protein DMA11_23170 [Marinilabiliaceae bacterium JC017]|nr:hypothetical protein DMA11_23170 [Marinilabiliaceae bacterium JC017]
MYKQKLFTPLILTLLFFLTTTAHSQDLKLACQANDTFDNIKAITVKGIFAKVNITGHQQNNVILNGTLKAIKPEGYNIKHTVTGNTLEVMVAIPQTTASSHTGEVQLTIPDNIPVTIENTSGYATIKNVKTSSLNITSKSGKINITNSDATMTLHTVTGAIKVDQTNGNVTTKSKSGEQYIQNITGNVKAVTNSGQLNIKTITGIITAESTSGNQEYENIKGDITTKASSGNIKISIAESNILITAAKGDVQLFQTNGTLNVTTTKGNQSGTRIKLAAASSLTSTEGKIKMKLDMPKDQLAFQLQSTNSYLFALGKSKKKKLKIGKGPILLTGTSTTGSQSYY